MVYYLVTSFIIRLGSLNV